MNDYDIYKLVGKYYMCVCMCVCACVCVKRRSKIDTAFWLIMNDYDIYKLVGNCCFEDDRARDAAKVKLFITDKDWEGTLELPTTVIKN